MKNIQSENAVGKCLFVCVRACVCTSVHVSSLERIHTLPFLLPLPHCFLKDFLSKAVTISFLAFALS